MIVLNYPLVSSQSMTASFNSSPIQLTEQLGFALAVIITGTPTGTLILQASCDPPQQPGSATVPTNWITIGGTSQAIAGAATNILYNIADVYYNWIRLNYTAAASTGTMIANLQTKGW